MPHIRPATPDDADTLAALVHAAYLGQFPVHPEQYRTANPAPGHLHLVAAQGHDVTAAVHITPFGERAPRAARLQFAGDHAQYAALYTAALTHLPSGTRTLISVVREDHTPQRAFLDAAAFRNAHQSWGAHLDLRTFNPDAHRALDERRYLEGYEIARLTHPAPAPTWAALHALTLEAVRDAPRNPTTTPDDLTPETLRATVEREEQVWVATYRNEITGFTRLTPRGTHAESELTAVTRAHRRRGLATLLKMHALTWARTQGLTSAGTGGNVHNLPMLRVNARLGYRVEPMWITYTRDMPGHGNSDA
ncbi:GNAT family N-acetyltransferase [Deinococcus maricopensis]|uniref:GCN5-related N-acetyltransferase n=1 Tax=Deinococcus maricopensis (strain DSM 21211 / LMG 22137 / NRRL B-23946 / LB-34) TaxID=709986 RepID=E8U5M5_DEIML|nr:GNAT family N-acetyltransferase [Deinococcus maricopensis]ADV66364.1 GCN5-related N-acetyltransferase [Deinococcus maricopensis DSM 21211]